jgi:hypothetical protein
MPSYRVVVLAARGKVPRSSPNRHVQPGNYPLLLNVQQHNYEVTCTTLPNILNRIGFNSYSCPSFRLVIHINSIPCPPKTPCHAMPGILHTSTRRAAAPQSSPMKRRSHKSNRQSNKQHRNNKLANLLRGTRVHIKLLHQTLQFPLALILNI